MVDKPNLDEAAQIILNCVCAALADAGREPCICSTTIGVPMVSAVCDCGKREKSGELWVSLVDIYAAEPTTLARASEVFPCKRSTVVAEYRVAVSRCFPTIDERGELPSPESQADAAAEMHADVQDLWVALTCCVPEQTRLTVTNFAVEDPEGGISAFSITVGVEVKPTRTPVTS